MGQPQEKIMTYYSILKTPLDDLVLVANPIELIGLYFSESGDAPGMRSDWVLNPRHAVLVQAREQIQEYLEGARTTFSLPLRFNGTAFQQRVWQQIALIPFGQTITYSELAKRAGAPDAVRAAGAATGKNPIGIIIPCHRVVGKDGSLTGFAGGLAIKRQLLDLENGIKNLDLQIPHANASRQR
jgi:methylated-DNA-[protein]-cysteine S-methyltransferase